MFAKIAIIACVIAVARAGVIAGPAYTSYAAPAPYASYAAPAAYASYAAPAAYASYEAPSLSSTSQNVYRSEGNLNTISTHSKSIATPFSSSNKQVTTVTNPAVYAHTAPVYAAAAPAPLAYSHAPVAAATYAAPAPLAHAAPAGLLGVAYSPAVAVSHMTYSAPAISYGW